MPIHKPPRPYGKLLKSLRQVWKIILLDEGHIWRFGVSERNTGGDVIRIAAWNICKGSGGILFEHDFRIISQYAFDYKDEANKTKHKQTQVNKRRSTKSTKTTFEAVRIQDDYVFT